MLILYTLLLFSTGGHCYYSLLWQEEVSTLKCKLLPLHCTVHSSWDHRSRWQSSTFYTLKPAAKNSAGQCVHGRAAGVNAEVQTFCATSPPAASTLLCCSTHLCCCCCCCSAAATALPFCRAPSLGQQPQV